LFLCDIDDDLLSKKISLVLPTDLPDNYISDPDSYHNEFLGLSKEDELIILEKVAQ
jgi:hypothetical protein